MEELTRQRRSEFQVEEITKAQKHGMLVELDIAWQGKRINQCLMREAELIVIDNKRLITSIWVYIMVKSCLCNRSWGLKWAEQAVRKKR